MALIVEYHVVADMYPVGASAISAGMIITLDATGLAVPAPIGTSVGKVAVGIAGDSALAAEGQTTPYSAQVVIGADGAGTRWTENRVTDFYDETTSSQKITVYNGGGKFWISDDLFDAPASVTVGQTLGISGTTVGEWKEAATVVDDDICGISVGLASSYPSGVPGTDTDGHIALANAGTNTWIPVLCRL